jgi:acylphosphatase
MPAEAAQWPVVSKVTEVTAVRLVAWVEGRVQGVGFRWWVRSRALELGLVGFAENLADGRVKVVAEGASGPCNDLLALLADCPASGDGMRRPGRVSRVAHRWTDATGDMSGFTER